MLFEVILRAFHIDVFPRGKFRTYSIKGSSAGCDIALQAQLKNSLKVLTITTFQCVCLPPSFKCHNDCLRANGSVVEAIDSLGAGFNSAREKKKRSIVKAITTLPTYSGKGTWIMGLNRHAIARNKPVQMKRRKLVACTNTTIAAAEITKLKSSSRSGNVRVNAIAISAVSALHFMSLIIIEFTLALITSSRLSGLLAAGSCLCCNMRVQCRTNHVRNPNPRSSVQHVS